MTTSPIPILLSALAVCALSACGPKIVRDRVYDKPAVRVELRHQLVDGAPVPRGYAQPTTIADVRIAHILASLAYEDDDQKRQPLIRSQFVYELAEGIALALAKAGPDDEIAAAAFPVDRRLGIFTDERVTAFRLCLVGDQMQIEFYAVEQGLERDGSKIGAREYDIPTELPTLKPSFRVVVGEAQQKLGARGVEVAWRNDYYRRPVSLGFSQGQARRRTILMELPPDATPAAAETPLPPNLSDAQLRALDELDGARQSGLVKESDFQRRRQLIIDNKLDEAGYGKVP